LNWLKLQLLLTVTEDFVLRKHISIIWFGNVKILQPRKLLWETIYCIINLFQKSPDVKSSGFACRCMANLAPLNNYDPNYWTPHCGMLSNDNNETSLIFTHSLWHQFYSEVKWLTIILSLDINYDDKYLPWLGVHFEVCQKLYVYFFLVNIDILY